MRGESRRMRREDFLMGAIAPALARLERETGGRLGVMAADTSGRHTILTKAQLLEYAPVTRAHAGEGYMTVEARTLPDRKHVLRAGLPASWRVGGSKLAADKRDAILASVGRIVA